MNLRRPSGAPPPASAELDGQRYDLAATAAEVCLHYYEQYPDEHERYGPAGTDWCRHDNQWLLFWAINDVLGATDLGEQVCWLARILHARDFPVSRLAHNLRLASGIVVDGSFGPASAAVAARLTLAAETVDGLDLGRDGSQD